MKVNTELDIQKIDVSEIPDELFATLSDDEKDSEFVAVESKTYFQDAWGRFKKNKLALIGLVFILLMVIGAIVVPMVSPYSYDAQDMLSRNSSPSWAHPFGTDKFGRDILVRVMYGARISLSIGFATAAINLVIGIVYGAVLAIGQTDVMRLIAYTSISHFGFIVLGIFALTSQGQAGSTLYMVNHGISTAALFLIAGFLVSRRGDRTIAAYGGVQKVAPVLAGTFLVAGLATLSLPGLAPFVSEFLVFVGTYPRYQVAAVIATLALVLSALYVLWLYQRMMGGPVRLPGGDDGDDGNDGAEHARRLSDLVPREVAVVAPLIALLLILGIYPKPALDVITPAVDDTLVSIEISRPEPVVPAERPVAESGVPAHGSEEGEAE